MEFERLDLREIRLLEVLPSSNRTLVASQLKRVSLNENPLYEALSHCWGHFRQKVYPSPAMGLSCWLRRTYIQLCSGFSSDMRCGHCG
jgi:hypothetical protein